MSGGQQQRVAIARTLAAQPPVILADEPTGNLDSASSKEILQILKNMHEQGKTVILITHDNGIAAQQQEARAKAQAEAEKQQKNTVTVSGRTSYISDRDAATVSEKTYGFKYAV